MVTEDELYRSSTQYRLWNFTADRLTALRRKTNKVAIDQAKKAIKRRRHAIKKSHNDTPSGDGSSTPHEDETEFLSFEEEKIIVDLYCTQLIHMVNTGSRHIKEYFSALNVSTAIQFIKRFYLTNSVISYHPKNIMLTALYLARKTEGLHPVATEFVHILNKIPGLESLTPDEVLAPEYILTQGLRFCFDIRHPHRALKGLYMEILILIGFARGDPLPAHWKGVTVQVDGGGGVGIGASAKSSLDVQRYLLQTYKTPASFQKRAETAYNESYGMLKGEVLASDAYFLYTPSQIALAALYSRDAQIARDLLKIKLTMPSAASTAGGVPLVARRASYEAVLAEVEGCVSEMKIEQIGKEVRRSVSKKLDLCRNPDKVDLVGLNQAKKRDAAEDGKLDEKLVKKRKLEREKNEKEGEALFGPALTK